MTANFFVTLWLCKSNMQLHYPYINCSWVGECFADVLGPHGWVGGLLVAVAASASHSISSCNWGGAIKRVKGLELI